MTSAAHFLERAKARGLTFFSGVPCSYLGALFEAVRQDAEVTWVGATNEGDALAVASGAELGGRDAVVMMQNSGLGNAVNPLVSLNLVLEIPALLLITWRGEPGASPDEPQHAVMGEITPRLLEVCGIPWAAFPLENEEVDAVLDVAISTMKARRRPYALVVGRGALKREQASQPSSAKTPERPRRAVGGETLARRAGDARLDPSTSVRRLDVLSAIRDAGRSDVLVATTGYTGRELYALGDRPNQLYMVGSMGCASALGLGLALARPARRIVVLDGDGALLMRLGSVPMIGGSAAENLVHVVLDNGQHESTGGQPTPRADFVAMALASGYFAAARATTTEAVLRAVEGRGPRLVHVPIVAGVGSDLPRPTVTPREVASRLRAWLDVAAPLAARPNHAEVP